MSDVAGLRLSRQPRLRRGTYALGMALALPLLSCGGTGQGGPAADLASLRVTPGQLSECGAGPASVEVAWDATRAGVSRVRVEVGQLGMAESRLFFEGDVAASAATGPWAGIGTVFLLVDDGTGDVLAHHEITGLACL